MMATKRLKDLIFKIDVMGDLFIEQSYPIIKEKYIIRLNKRQQRALRDWLNQQELPYNKCNEYEQNPPRVCVESIRGGYCAYGPWAKCSNGKPHRSAK